MKTNFNDIDDLLVKYLAGEATEAEKSEVQQWLQSGESNRRYYDHFRLIWEESLRLAATTTVDEQGAWERFKQRTRQPAPVRQLPSAGWIRVAAILVLALGLGWLAWSLLSGPGEVTLAVVESTGEVKIDTLPDGSVITLNKHSSASWPQQFTGNVRKVQLSGEGFFSVKPDKQKPFIVNAGNNILIEVLGTSFNVRSRNDSTEVIVETGHVQVSWQEQSVSLVAGEKVVIKTGEGIEPKQEVNDRLYNYYRSRTFVCDNTPLWKLVEVLNEAYDANIIIDRPGLREQPLTATFENQPLDSVLNIVRNTLDFTVVKQNDTILLR